MTKNSDLKQRIRDRMKRTGERYTAARAHVLAAAHPIERPNAYPGLIPGYPGLGGIQSDTALLGRVLAHAGIVHPATGQPYGEALIHGLCGGVGFLYAVFEYKGHAPMLTVVMRSRSMPQTYLHGIFERVGARRVLSKTSSARVATKTLERALEEQTPAVCVVDLALLPHTRLPDQMPGMSPHYVAVIGADGDRVWLDDRSLVPIPISRDELAAARAGCRSAKHALFTVQPSGEDPDWKHELHSAIRDTVQTMRAGDPTVPPYFRTNCGLSGLTKWQRLLSDAKDKKGWPKVFSAGADALAGLRRAYDGIQHEYTPPQAGRPLYADFLDEAAELLGDTKLKDSSRLFRESGARWQALADCIAAAPDAAVADACRLADRRSEALDGGSRAPASVAKTQPVACQLDAAEAAALYGRMAEILGGIVDIETRAVDSLAAVK